MKFHEFLQLHDDELPNEAVVGNVVVPGELSLGPLKPGVRFDEIRTWPLDWHDDAEDGTRLAFASKCVDYIRLQTLSVARDDEGLVRYVEWILNLNVPPSSPQLAGPEPGLAAAFESSLGKPKKNTKAGKKWISGDTSLMLAHGVDGTHGTEFAGFLVIGVLHEPFRNRALLDPKFRKL